MTIKKILYLVTPYSQVPQDKMAWVIKITHSRKRSLENRDYIVFSPILESHYHNDFLLWDGERREHTFWMERDFAFLECFKKNEGGFALCLDSELLMLWKSKGAEMEKEWAQKNNVEIVNYLELVQ